MTNTSKEIIQSIQNELNQKLSNDILEKLAGWKTEDGQLNWKDGASISYIMESLRNIGWKNLGRMYEFECLIEKLGFSIIPGKLKNGQNHKSVRVITI